MSGAKPAGMTTDPLHARTVAEVAKALGTDLQTGLSAAEAATRLVANGPNSLAVSRERSVVGLVLSQLASPLIYLLFAAGVISLLLGHRGDAVMIGCVVVINAVIGALQEGRAARSLRALRTVSTTTARVVRDGHEVRIPSAELVVGDLLVVEAGDAVGADARLVECVHLQTAEAALTGESLPVAKQPERVPAEASRERALPRQFVPTPTTPFTAARTRSAMGPTWSASVRGSSTANSSPP